MNVNDYAIIMKMWQVIIQLNYLGCGCLLVVAGGHGLSSYSSSSIPSITLSGHWPSTCRVLYCSDLKYALVGRQKLLHCKNNNVTLTQ